MLSQSEEVPVAGPLDGIRVVELGLWVAGPSAAAILCDWGADVIKVEPPNGDPLRGLFASATGWPIPINPPFELDNRGKRSIALNLGAEEGREITRALIDQADVFVTNVRPKVLDASGLSYERLRESNPGLVYCQVTGYGPDGPNRDRAAYDIGAFWARAGVAAALTPQGAGLPHQRVGMGDHVAGSNAAGAVCAALFARSRTGEGQRVSASLIRAGVYVGGADVSIALRLKLPIQPYDRYHAVNPIIDCYQAGDGRWFWLLLLQGDRHWPDLCRAIKREDLLDDPRFANISLRLQNAPALVEELDRVFATKALDEWGEVFDRENVWWAPVNSVNEVVNDPVVHEAGAFVEVPGPEGSVAVVATPADFYGTPAGPQGLPPEVGQHTEEVLLELGYDWDRIIALKEGGVIP
jgi:crotonobetainyl-CoA:carnitine CoA-transferase CaiB-like acyl-CoA transferase